MMRKVISIVLLISMLICFTSCGGHTRIFPISYGEAKGLVKYILKHEGVKTKCESVEIIKNEDGSLAEVHIHFVKVLNGDANVAARANEYASLHPEDELFNGETKICISLDFSGSIRRPYTEITNYESRVIDGEEIVEIRPRMFTISHDEFVPDTPVPDMEVIYIRGVIVDPEWLQGATGIRRVYLGSPLSDYYTEEVLLEFEEAYPDIEFILQ